MRGPGPGARHRWLDKGSQGTWPSLSLQGSFETQESDHFGVVNRASVWAPGSGATATESSSPMLGSRPCRSGYVTLGKSPYLSEPPEWEKTMYVKYRAHSSAQSKQCRMWSPLISLLLMTPGGTLTRSTLISPLLSNTFYYIVTPESTSMARGPSSFREWPQRMLGITAARLPMRSAQTKRQSPSTTQVPRPWASQERGFLPPSLPSTHKYVLSTCCVPGHGDTTMNAWSLPSGEAQNR